MKHLFLTILLANLCTVTGYGQTLKSVMIDTNGVQVNQFGSGSASNTAIKLGGTNWGFWQATGPDRILLSIGGATGATFTSNSITTATFSGNLSGGVTIGPGQSISFSGGANVSGTRTNLGLGATWLTNDNVTNFRTAIGLGENDGVIFDSLTAINFQATAGTNYVQFNSYSVEFGGISASRTRTNLGLGPTNIVTFAGLTNNGDITINSTTASNGLLFIRRTNNEPFLGLANLLASNNTTISNETLFRVGVAEATNRSAQFGFRSTNTNGNGVAVFSVFGYNALMMVGADASTNAVIFSGGGTNNEVMTLIKSGATEFARPISFSTTAHAAATRTNLALGATSDPTFRDVSVRDLSIVGGSGGKIVYPATNTAPADTTNVATWIQVNVGTNSYRVPLYQ
jgi:hypothetical protein